MENVKVKGVDLEFYDSIDVMITSRFMQFNKFFAMENMSAPNLEAIHKQELEALTLLKSERYEDLEKLIKNRSQALAMALNNINPNTLSQACFISSINGEKKVRTKDGVLNLNDSSDEGIKKVANYIEGLDTSKGKIFQLVESLKKKFNSKLTRFFLTWKMNNI